MKTSRLLLGSLSVVLSVLLVRGTRAQNIGDDQVGGPERAAESNSDTNGAYRVVERGANYRVWERAANELKPSGQRAGRPQRYIELASGLNYLKDGQWVDSKEEITLMPDGTAAALQGQYQAHFPGNINEGFIELVTPEGKQLRSRPLGLSYDDGKHTVWIAELKDSVGQMVGSNQVIYPDAFTDFKADLRYTYTKGGFEQDIILREQPPTPNRYGLDPATARLQLLTEFFDPPQPRLTKSKLAPQAGVALGDDALDFGATRMMPGRAFLLGSEGHSAGAAVGKSWVNLEGRQFLVEEVPVGALTDELGQLPAPATASLKVNPQAALHLVSARRLLPAPRLTRNGPGERLKQMAQNTFSGRGLVLDYQTLVGAWTNYVFQEDTTYYISGTVGLFGTNTFEGGTVLKFATNGSLQIVPGPPGLSPGINWLGNPYRPVIFTAKDDNTVGQAVGTGTPVGYYGNPMVLVANVSIQAAISNLRVSYAGLAFQFGGGSANFYNVQFVNCRYGMTLGGAHVLLGNALFANIQTNFVFQGGSFVTAENVTFANSALLATAPSSQAGNSLFVTNSIFCNVTNVLVGAYSQAVGGYNGFYNTPLTWDNAYPGSVYPFQTAGAGNYYLASNSGLQGQGFASAIDPTLLASLKARTTYPPIMVTNGISTPVIWQPAVPRDTNGVILDLGYHYDALDYLVNGATLNSSLTLTNGVAVGVASYMILGTSSSLITSVGQPQLMNRIAFGHQVQEQPPVEPGYFLVGGSFTTSLSFRFTDFSFGSGGPMPLFYVYAVPTGLTMTMQDCSLRGLDVECTPNNSGPIFNLRNNLISRGITTVGNSMSLLSGPNFNCYNNTFVGGTLNVGLITGANTVPTWNIKDNLFDGAVQSLSTDSGGANQISAANNGFSIGTTNSLGGNNNQTNFTANYQNGPLGNNYLPGNSILTNAGSRTADLAGLYQYTTQTNQVEESTSQVDIGYHYVATDGNGVPQDSDVDGIPDYLEDANGSGVYDGGDPSDWTDYYNGVLPTLLVASGNNQSGPLGSFLPLPLTVQVLNSGSSPLTNAPLTFSVTNGLKELALTLNGTVSTNLLLQTDANGYARVYVYLPTNAPVSNIVLVTAQSGASSTQVIFTETEGLVATPVIFPAGGSYAVQQKVTVTCATVGAIIHYTMSGVDPGEFDPVVANGGHLMVLTNLTLKARAFTNSILLPSAVTSASYVLTGAIAAGRKHTLALRIDGVVLGGGSGGNGQIGDGTTHLRTNLVTVAGLTNVVGIAAGELFSFAWKNDGTAWALAWGEDLYGQTGNAAFLHQQTNVMQITNLTAIASMSAGFHHGLALNTNGQVWAWGMNNWGQVGVGGLNIPVPLQMTNLSSMIGIAAGGYHSLALKAGGTVWGWGKAEYGQLGDGSTPPYRTIPVRTANLTNVIAIAAGKDNGLALSNGVVWAWGANYYGQLGTSNFNQQNIPVRVIGLSNVVAIAAGAYHGLALKSDGTVWAWGDNQHGQVGNCSNNPFQTVPVQVNGLSNVVAVSVGGEHSVALKSDGTIVQWGFINYGQEAAYSACPIIEEPGVHISLLPPVMLAVAGSASMRSVVFDRLGYLFDPGYTCVSNGVNMVTFQGTMYNRVPALAGNLVTVYCSFSNSVSGIVAVENNSTVPTLQLGGAMTNQIPNLVFSTLFPSTIGYRDWQFDHTALGVLPHLLVCNNAVQGMNNVTPALASWLLQYSGPSSDPNYAHALPAGKFNISSPLSVYLAGDADADLFAFLGASFNLPANTILFWTTNGAGQYSNGSQYYYYHGVYNQSNYPDIYSSPGNLPAYSYGTAPDLIASRSDTLGYVTLAQYNSVLSNVTPVSYNGVPFSPANVANGSYALWGYEHVLNSANSLTSGQQTVRDALINAITDPTYQATAIFSNSFIPLSNMQVDRVVDGGLIVPRQF
jgi:alpha-tubulin suppressor-like RCC1 family protein